MRLDALSWLSKMTLDVIGEAGFNYRFNALKSEGNELNEAFKTMFGAAQALSPLPVLQAYIPVLRLIVSVASYLIESWDGMGIFPSLQCWLSCTSVYTSISSLYLASYISLCLLRLASDSDSYS